MMRSADITRVRDLPLFRDMAAPHFHALLNAALLQKFPERVTLIEEGEVPDFLHILVEGTVELFAACNGRETTIDILQPVTTFILAAVIRDEVHLKSARTLTPARVLMIPAPAVRDIFDRNSAFARAIVNELAERYRAVVRILKDQKLRNGPERLANWILEEERRQGSGGRVLLKHEKRTLSSLLGMTPENLSRNLATLASYGAVSEGREIVISDRATLQRLAKQGSIVAARQ